MTEYGLAHSGREEELAGQVPVIKSLFDLRGKVVIVTGASRGIGAGVAKRFAEAGASVVVGYHRQRARAQAVVKAIAESGRESVALAGDLTRRADVVRLLAESLDAFGRVDVLVNNAGTYPLVSLLEMNDAAWRSVLHANLSSVYLCTQLIAKQMIEQGTGGAIVNIASIEAEAPAPMHSHYSAAKAGVLMYTRAAAAELGAHDIRVNAVSPGLIWREGIEQEWPDGVTRYGQAAPLQRLGRPEDVADACLFLASPAARWITGANLIVDGGVMTRMPY